MTSFFVASPKVARRIMTIVCCLQLLQQQVRADEPDTSANEALPLAVQRESTRNIRRFVIEGNKRFPQEVLQEQLRRFIGRNRTVADIEAARETLQTFFLEQGYAGTEVVIGEQPSAASTVLLEVRELRPEPAPEEKTAEAGAGETAVVPPVVAEKAPEKPPVLSTPQQPDKKEASVEKKPAEADDYALLPEEPVAKPSAKSESFTIKGFTIEGTYLFSQEELQQRVKQFTGRNRTAADVEGARDALERFFHDRGYPAMLVNIPEQSGSNKLFRLVVIENRIENVLISGNTHVSTQKILRDIPSVIPGTVLNLQDLQRDIGRVNRNPDVKVIPEMQIGKTPETIDISLKVQDKLPLHGSLEINNRSSHDTTDLRLNAALRYDNLWQRDHSISVQYQVAPQAPDEVQVFSSSYTMPLFWNPDDKLVVYGVISNSNTNSALGYSNLGKGSIVGTRLILPLQGTDSFFHTAVAGFDYKDFSETVGLAGAAGDKTPISYLPITAAYSAYLKDGSGLTSFNAGITLLFRGGVNDIRQFEDKRFKSTGNPISMTAGLERNQQLPYGLSLLAKLDGQLCDQPLISNEQYTSGGSESVRGYHESEASGDNALHGTVELSAPDLFKKVLGERVSLTPFLFYDMAQLWVRNPQSGQGFTDLQGTGFGLRGTLLGGFDFQTDVAFPLRDTKLTVSGEPYVHFKVRWQF
ncbi:MAG: BamA/TamA family outer membrane protein [Desulfuromonadales bacterium]|nr:BamA/TamA family outer membrane protein [Desulfuromonadales bacterium]